MYQFRFGGEETDILNIFKDVELSKAFESSFMENYGLMLNRIREYKAFLLSKNIPNDEGLTAFSIEFSEDEAISVFKQDLKRYILYLAMKDIFFSKLNVKHNIMERLTVDFIRQCVLDKHFLSSINSSGVYVEDVSLGLPYEVLDDLVSEFLQK